MPPTPPPWAGTCLHGAGEVHVAGDAEQLGAGVVLTAEAGEPLGAPGDGNNRPVDRREERGESEGDEISSPKKAIVSRKLR